MYGSGRCSALVLRQARCRRERPHDWRGACRKSQHQAARQEEGSRRLAAAYSSRCGSSGAVENETRPMPPASQNVRTRRSTSSPETPNRSSATGNAGRHNAGGVQRGAVAAFVTVHALCTAEDIQPRGVDSIHTKPAHNIYPPINPDLRRAAVVRQRCRVQRAVKAW